MLWFCVVLLILIIILSLILFLPIRVVIKYPNETVFKLIIFGIPVKIPKGKKSKDSKSYSGSEKSERKVFETFKKREFVKSMKMLYNILSACSEALKKLMSEITVNKFKVLIKTGAHDSASAAIRYGQASAVFYPLLSLFNSVASPKEFFAEIRPDFSDNGLSANIELDFSSNIFRMLCVFFVVIKKYRKLAYS